MAKWLPRKLLQSELMRGLVMIERLIPRNRTVFVSDFPESLQAFFCRRYRLMNPHVADLTESEVRRLLDEIDLASAFGVGS